MTQHALKQKNKEIFGTMEPPKWKRAPLPEGLFPIELKKQDYDTQNEGNVTVRDFEGLYPDNPPEKKGLGEVFTTYVKGYQNSGYEILAHRGDAKVTVKAHHLNSSAEINAIVAEPGAVLEVIFDYTSDDAVQHHGITRVHAKKGSRVKVVKVQRLSEDSLYFHQVFTEVEEGAELEVVDVQLGSKFKAIAHESQLLGRHSKSSIKSLYYGANTDQLDLSFTMRHHGAHSESEILSKGALDHQAKKVFRGNLMFDTGAAQSVGREKEYVVVLNEKVHSDSIPALLCSEDDVIGEHAASIGQIDRDKLFYLMSRGLSEAEAKKLIVAASFQEILQCLSDASIRDALTTALERRLS